MYTSTMKITEQDYNRLSGLILDVVEKNKIRHRSDYDMTIIRYIWDIFHAACDYCQYNNVNDYLFIRGLYGYLADKHMDTTLKRILKAYI